MSTSSSPQRNLRSQIYLNQSDILSLSTANSGLGKLILPTQTDYINVFSSATCQYIYKNSILTDVDNVLSFYQKPALGSAVLVSNQINALNFMGLQQNGSLNFIAANPYSPSMKDMVDAPIYFNIANDNPLGGDPTSLIVVMITYDLYLS